MGAQPLFCLQYLSVVPDIQGVIGGDSLMCGPAGPRGDGFSVAPIRAAYDLSSPSLPICVVHLACGGEASPVYNETLWLNMDALRPSFMVLQPLSRNDGMEQAQLNTLFARLLATADRAATEYRRQHNVSGRLSNPQCRSGRRRPHSGRSPPGKTFA